PVVPWLKERPRQDSDGSAGRTGACRHRGPHVHRRWLGEGSNGAAFALALRPAAAPPGWCSPSIGDDGIAGSLPQSVLTVNVAYRARSGAHDERVSRGTA